MCHSTMAKRLRHPRRGARQHTKKKRTRRKQKGRGLHTAAAQGIYEVLKAAGRHARSLSKNNLFRRMTVNRFGLPPGLQKRMYNN